jgi:cellulose synthase/poly-beta-1,6-N-acetylglucosamine synthase-like glycosyltransferase
MTQTLTELYGSLPLWLQVLQGTTLVVILCSVLSVVVLFVCAARFRRRTNRLRRDGVGAREKDFLWVFVVPALNEEVTIADSIARLQQTHATHAVVLAIDDGSDDGTGEILAGIADDRLHVLTRTAPHARRGKAAALNDAYRYLNSSILTDPAYARWTPQQVIVAIVDADGRLDPSAPTSAGMHFADDRVGGLQVLVRIYNRRSPLTWAQDVEFTAFGRLFQAGRAWWGTANLGGNGQFTRLAALDAVDDGSGPWRNTLTEDQDLGVRIIQAGWANAQDNDATIHQQGLNSLRRLYRQRVRWAQGNWQAFSLLGGVGRPSLPPVARIDSVFYLLTPLLQLLMGTSFLISVAMWALDIGPRSVTVWWVLALFLALSLGPTIAILLLRQGPWHSRLLGVLLVVPYTIYSWIIFPVLAASLLRQALGRNSWAKTPRESIDDEPPLATIGT